MRRKRIALGIVVIFFIQSCSVNQNIVGVWNLNNQTQLNYPIINFGEDSTAVFSSKMDTVYSMKYYQKHNKLYLVRPNGDIIKQKIIYLSEDSLVLKSLIENKEKQIYKKYNIHNESASYSPKAVNNVFDFNINDNINLSQLWQQPASTIFSVLGKPDNSKYLKTYVDIFRYVSVYTYDKYNMELVLTSGVRLEKKDRRKNKLKKNRRVCKISVKLIEKFYEK